ncbi:replicative DNA helicase [Streptomyces melanogenes]|uniref:replicative DNA helicase n=1 Tax=Streptomyces melanogenes TaxID=67326 RepID=UPI0037A05EF5
MSDPDDSADALGPFAVPYDREAEQAVLGALLLAPGAVEAVVAVLRSGADFHEPAHQEVYRAALAVHDRPGVRADPLTVAAELGRRGSLARVGGAAYLHALVQAVPTAANAGHYAEKVVETARRRQLIRTLTAGLQRASMAEVGPEDAAEAVLAELRGLAGDGGERRSLWLGDLVPQFVDELEAGRDPDALDTPWPDLNAVVELKPGQLITVGAATGGGKSLFAMNLVAHVGLRRGRPVLMASLEMGGKELVARLFASEATVPLDRLVRRRVEDADWQRMAEVTGALQRAPVLLDDTPSLSVATLRSRIRWMAAQGRPPALVVVDYLQLLTPERSGRATTRAQEVGEISRGLKLLAGEFGVPVVALAQFNRGAVGRRPLVSDFKESSAIEQDSNVIVLLHRELGEDGADTGPKAGTVEAIVAKNRNGAAGRVVELAFQGHYGRLTSLHA